MAISGLKANISPRLWLMRYLIILNRNQLNELRKSWHLFSSLNVTFVCRREKNTKEIEKKRSSEAPKAFMKNSPNIEIKLIQDQNYKDQRHLASAPLNKELLRGSVFQPNFTQSMCWFGCNIKGKCIRQIALKISFSFLIMLSSPLTSKHIRRCSKILTFWVFMSLPLDISEFEIWHWI